MSQQITTTTFEMNYSSKFLELKFKADKNATKLEKSRTAQANRKTSFDTNTIEIRQNNGNNFNTNLVSGRGDITFQYDVNGVGQHNDGKKLVKCVCKVENFKAEQVPEGLTEIERLWFCKGKLPLPLTVTDDKGKNRKQSDKVILKNCLFRVKHQNSKSFEQCSGARTIIEVYSHD